MECHTRPAAGLQRQYRWPSNPNTSPSPQTDSNGRCACRAVSDTFSFLGNAHPQSPQGMPTVCALALDRLMFLVTPTATGGNLFRASSVAFRSLRFAVTAPRRCVPYTPRVRPPLRTPSAISLLVTTSLEVLQRDFQDKENPSCAIHDTLHPTVH